MRKKYKKRQLASSSSLLLDTLCNTLGSVIFIAILVLIIVQQTPLGEVDVPEVTADQKAFLATTPNSQELEQQLRRLRSQVEQYSQSGIVAKTSDSSLSDLLSERTALVSRYRKIERSIQGVKLGPELEPKIPEPPLATEQAYAFPVVKTLTGSLTSVILFTGNEFFYTQLPTNPVVRPGARRINNAGYHEADLKVTPMGLIKVVPALNKLPARDRGVKELSALLSNYGNVSGRVNIYVTPSGLEKFSEVAPAIFTAPINISLYTHSDDVGVTLHPSRGPAPSYGF